MTFITDKTEPHLLAFIGETIAGTWSWLTDPVQTIFETCRGDSAGSFMSNINDSEEFAYKPVYLKAGNYNLNITSIRANNTGIFRIDVNGIAVGSPIDLYNVSTIYNVVLSPIAITIPYDMMVTINIRVTGKNGSSSQYKVYVSKFTITKA